MTGGGSCGLRRKAVEEAGGGADRGEELAEETKGGR